jgi:hypothetical protein
MAPNAHDAGGRETCSDTRGFPHGRGPVSGDPCCDDSYVHTVVPAVIKQMSANLARIIQLPARSRRSGRKANFCFTWHFRQPVRRFRQRTLWPGGAVPGSTSS